MQLDNKGYRILNFPDVDKSIHDSFSNLKLDEYASGGTRYRRFSQYKLQFNDHEWNMDVLPHKAYMTYSKFNSVAGGIKRYYEPLESDFTEQILSAVKQVKLDSNDDWQINVHQYRVVSSKDRPGIPVPEGVHQDGHDYVAIFVFNRYGIEGGEMSLLKSNNIEDAFYTGTIKPGEVAILDDRSMFHYVTDIRAIDERGYRDTVVVAFSKWKDRWYGEEFENKVLGEG
ncbi:2OG-Fe dioxygenase family protein [Moritella marina ATCC 15381]|uniref:2OG-Fe dioxygenase family protein n=1 Tax=Moritella marina ATCC 15381 TaxID=1202962 RepID=A0A5J6WGC7_MORMI|nr:2OG-Fe dioxygenase family protein [Moritella marina]QFI37026.1 2OG-Fe dioxygenase family protein [Moritella marina ATCC 15381]